MFDHLDIVDTRYVDVVQAAITEGRVLCKVQGIHSAIDVDSILYGECFAALRGQDGRVYGACDFIPALETMHEAPLIDQYMLDQVLDRLEHDGNAVLGCNLSADNFSNQDMWAGVLSQIQTRPQLAERLVLEITETQAFECLTFSAHAITNIRSFGCRVALDDFGAGFASPRLLQLINFDIVKIDKAFIRDIRPSASGSDSLSHLVGLASSFAPIIVVEGIETKQQAETALVAGATHIQGHYLSMPIAYDAVVRNDVRIA
ncbi:EAL domain-containing protein [Ochrobactrum quorumnocens]|uniref:EAL domain-containing protein n=1 Tax=Ochrobactrum quorumnocens TaxID=271865 RepID=UPI0038529BAF